MMEWLRSMAEETRLGLLAQVGRYKNREFMEAVTAGCALVALADGTISASEKQKMIQFMESSDELRIFPLEDVIAFFHRTVAKFDFDFEIGRLDALKTISKIKHDVTQSRVMVRVCCVIGGSDGNFDDDEKRMVSGICKTLGLNPTEFSLPAA